VRVSDLKPGDLVFFNTMRRTFSHVGIYIGDNKFVHSPSTGSTIRVDDMEDGYWEKRFQGARRIENAPVGDGSELRQRVSASIGGY
jgi:cell wall-associated NlpC family hydrolase